MSLLTVEVSILWWYVYCTYIRKDLQNLIICERRSYLYIQAYSECVKICFASSGITSCKIHFCSVKFYICIYVYLMILEYKSAHDFKSNFEWICTSAARSIWISTNFLFFYTYFHRRNYRIEFDGAREQNFHFESIIGLKSRNCVNSMCEIRSLKLYFRKTFFFVLVFFPLISC